MLTNILLIKRAWRIRFLRETPQGSVHGQRLADTPPSPLPPGSPLLQDLGLQAFTLKVWTVLHNFDCRATDRTTPAIRFFKRPFPDLFETVLSHMRPCLNRGGENTKSH
jgi:uncharacterized protein DUF6399